MRKLKNLIQMFLVVSMASLCMFGIAHGGQKATKGYNTPIPSSIMTPDKVETRIGTLNFFDGVPTEKTAELVLDNLMFLRGVEVFLNGLPMASTHALREGFKSIGVTEAHHIIVTDKLMDSNPLFLTRMGKKLIQPCSIKKNQIFQCG